MFNNKFLNFFLKQYFIVRLQIPDFLLDFFRKMITIPSQIKRKIESYCSYQERSHQEVKDKLYSFGLHKAEVESLLASLIENNFINEERFAVQFAGGKFRIKKWGRVKIKYALKIKKVSAYNIIKGLDTIDEEDYLNTLQKLVDKKWKLLIHNNLLIKKAACMQYLIQKGYERHLVKNAVEEVGGKEK